MDCVVNGPSESKHADIGISLPSNGEKLFAPVYEDGGKTVTLKGKSGISILLSAHLDSDFFSIF